MTRDLPTTLYRFFDAADVLLYVGISANPPKRFGQHQADKRWWLDVARITTVHYKNRPEALKAEAAAIKAESPLYNVVHNPTPVDELNFFEYLVRCEPRLLYLEESCVRRQLDYQDIAALSEAYRPDQRAARCMDDYWYNDLKPQIARLVGWRREVERGAPADVPVPVLSSMSDLLDLMEHNYEHPDCQTPREKLLSSSWAYDAVCWHLETLLPPCWPQPCPKCFGVDEEDEWSG